MTADPPNRTPDCANSIDGAPVAPKDLKIKLSEQKLFIEWQDGVGHEFALGRLRRQCPCATCRTEREAVKAQPLAILKVDPSTIRVTDAKLVGNYALQLIWSDGHKSGIFEFRFLRSLGESGDAAA